MGEIRTNIALLAGRLAATPETKVTKAGSKLTNLVLVCPKGADSKQFFLVVCWGKVSEVAAKLSPGTAVLVEAKLVSRESKNRNGAISCETEIVCEQLHILD